MATGEGAVVVLGPLPMGTVYPALARFRRATIVSSWVPACEGGESCLVWIAHVIWRGMMGRIESHMVVVTVSYRPKSDAGSSNALFVKTPLVSRFTIRPDDSSLRLMYYVTGARTAPS